MIWLAQDSASSLLRVADLVTSNIKAKKSEGIPPAGRNCFEVLGGAKPSLSYLLS
jgi:hypothetical protein